MIELENLTHSHSGSMIEWRYNSEEPITREDAQRLQMRAGFAPQGYGFYGFMAWKNETVSDLPRHGASWRCGNSCD